MIDRRLELDSALSQNSLSRSFQNDTSDGAKQFASPADHEAFERAMKKNAAPPANKVEPTLPPFSLFGIGSSTSEIQNTDLDTERLANVLRESAGRLLVSDDSKGQRREVRVDLKDELLPGVTVRVFEEEGRIVVMFICSNETSRERLTQCAPTFANELARSLERSLRIQVQTDDPQDLCLFEILAEPGVF